jgi:hypothetical protein
MTIDVHLDSNVWNFLFDRRIDLSDELPAPEFRLLIPREIELEIQPIPAAKADLRAFIRAHYRQMSGANRHPVRIRRQGAGSF